MWQCPNCAEQHEDTFDTCWKCGANSTGTRNPDFHVSKPATAEDQSPERVEEPQLPALRLPTVTYFAIPPCLWMNLAIQIQEFPADLSHLEARLSLSPTKIIVIAITVLFVGIPIFVELLRDYYVIISRKRRGRGYFSEAFRLLSIFLLPEPLRRNHRWFGLIYYVSIIAYVFLPIFMFVWQSVQAG